MLFVGFSAARAGVGAHRPKGLFETFQVGGEAAFVDGLAGGLLVEDRGGERRGRPDRRADGGSAGVER